MPAQGVERVEKSDDGHDQTNAIPSVEGDLQVIVICGENLLATENSEFQ